MLRNRSACTILNPLFCEVGSKSSIDNCRSLVGGKERAGGDDRALMATEETIGPEEQHVQAPFLDCKWFSFDFSIVYLTRIPGSAPLSGLNRNSSLPPGPAARTIPSETPKRILRGARLATITVSRPASASGV
jgi:hypothetical protein